MAAPEFQLKFFADYIQKNIGIVYSDQTYFQLEKRLEDLCKILLISDVDTLYKQASAGISGNLKQVLLDIATNNETSFFRDPKIFSAIDELIFSQMIAGSSKPNPFRIWSCASSFGQEPYSIAMLVQELSLKHPTLPRFEIVSTDISDKALARAKLGIYSQLEIQRGLSTQRLVKHFTKNTENNWTLSQDIRARVSFSKLNLLDPFDRIGKFDLILCRHVLIYQADDKKKDIISRISKSLQSRGYLVLGGTESMIGLSSDFEQISQQGAILYRLKR